MLLEDLIHAQNEWWSTGLPPRVKPLRRALQRKVLGRLLDTQDRRAHVILGPRQVGKTEILRQMVADLLAPGEGVVGVPPVNVTYFRFDDERAVDPTSAADVAAVRPPGAGEGAPRYLFLDEIRRSEGWDRWLKRTVDEARNLRIVVTDSAASLLRQGAIESGLGRWDEHRLEGLLFGEYLRLHDAGRNPGASAGELWALHPQTLEDYLAKGGFPEHVQAEVDMTLERLRVDIIDRAIRKDLSYLGVDVEEVRRLFVLLVQDSGAIFVRKNRAQDLEKHERTIGEHLRLLEDAQLIVSLPQWPRSARGSPLKAASRARTKRKLYAVDHGLVTAFASTPRPLSDPHTRARAFEAVVFRHLRAARETMGFEGPFFVRQDETEEIDFWIDTPHGSVAIETTTSGRIGPKAEQTRARARNWGARATLLVHGSMADIREDGARAIPLPVFLLDPERALGEVLP